MLDLLFMPSLIFEPFLLLTEGDLFLRKDPDEAILDLSSGTCSSKYSGSPDFN